MISQIPLHVLLDRGVVNVGIELAGFDFPFFSDLEIRQATLVANMVVMHEPHLLCVALPFSHETTIKVKPSLLYVYIYIYRHVVLFIYIYIYYNSLISKLCTKCTRQERYITEKSIRNLAKELKDKLLSLNLVGKLVNDQ